MRAGPPRGYTVIIHNTINKSNIATLCSMSRHKFETPHLGVLKSSWKLLSSYPCNRQKEKPSCFLHKKAAAPQYRGGGYFFVRSESVRESRYGATSAASSTSDRAGS